MPNTVNAGNPPADQLAQYLQNLRIPQSRINGILGNLDNSTPTQFVVDLLTEGIDLPEVDNILNSFGYRFLRFRDVFNEILGKKNIGINLLAGFAGMNPATIHKYISGKVAPSRDNILKLAIVMQLSYEETQVFLKSANLACLSAARPRDRIIMQGIVQNLSLVEIDDELKKKNEHQLIKEQKEE